MQISSTQKREIAKLAGKFELKLVLVFGSFANGKNHENSDLDIAIMSNGQIDFDGQIDLTNKLSSLFKNEVDLSVLNKANPLLLFQVSKNSRLLFGKKEDFLRFKLYAFRVYNDYAPYFELEKKLNKKLINAYVH